MIRKILWLFFCVSLITPNTVSAHDNHGGYEISINNEKVAHSSVPELSPSGILVPSYVGWSIYQPNQKITFTLDLNEYVIPREKTKYLVWNFGDDTAPKYGSTVTHTYTKAGSYILRLAYFEPEITPMPISVNETLVHIGPTDFQPPSGQVYVNGTLYDTPAENMPMDLEKELEFKFVPEVGTDVGELDVFWDFGGANTVTGNPVVYKYQRGPDGGQLDLVQAVVRFSTAEGYTNFRWVGLKNEPNNEIIEQPVPANKTIISPYIAIAVLFTTIFGAVVTLKIIEKKQ